MIRRREPISSSRPPRPVEHERQLAPAQRERLQHPGHAEEVVGVEVREEDLLQVDEADVRAEELALRPLAAVEQQPLAAAADERGGGSAARGRHRAGRAEEDDVEIHAASLGCAYGRISTWPGTISVPSRAFRSRISQTPFRGSL